MAGTEGSPVMSPAGSPGGTAGRQRDGAELVRRMMLATEAASTAATVAAQALAELKSHSAQRNDEKSQESLILRVERKSFRCGVILRGHWSST